MKNQTVDIYNTFSSELKLVLLCSQVEIIEKNLQTIHQLLDGPLDWDLFLNLAEQHHVYPLVYRSLTPLTNFVLPDKVTNVLKQKVWENTSKTLQMTGELVNVLCAMEENGIRAVVLKGIPLGYLMYGNLALRPSRDLDILVRPEDMEQAIKVIEDQGYERSYPSAVVTAGRLQNWMKINHHLGYWHREREIWLELHWRLSCYGLELPLKEIENSLIQVNIAGRAVNVPGQEELLLFLVIHGTSHAWFRLKWLCDVAGMLRKGRFSWDRLYGLSEQLGVEALLNQAVFLAIHLLQVPVPDNIVRKIMKDRKALSLVGLARPLILSINYDPTDFSKLLYYQNKKYEFCLQPGWRRKLVFLYIKFLKMRYRFRN